jgi:hypothetical protein
LENKIKGIKINLDFIFNNFLVHRTGLRLVKNNSRERKIDRIHIIELEKDFILFYFMGFSQQTKKNRNIKDKQDIVGIGK